MSSKESSNDAVMIARLDERTKGIAFSLDNLTKVNDAFHAKQSDLIEKHHTETTGKIDHLSNDFQKWKQRLIGILLTIGGLLELLRLGATIIIQHFWK